MKVYVIRGEPVALARARVAHYRVYDSQKQLKLLWGLEIKKQHGEDIILKDVPIFMDIIFYMPIPASWSQKKKDKMRGQWYFIKPDCSNLNKMAEDICNDICYYDDCQIARAQQEKVYDDGEGPRIEFILYELKGRREQRKVGEKF